MKRIKTTLMASVLACATFNAQAEVSPLSYGINAFGGLSAPIAYGDDVKIGGKKAGCDLYKFGGGGGLYLEYAITDYIGFAIHPAYLRENAHLKVKQGSQKGNTSSAAEEEGTQQGNTSSAAASTSIAMKSHSINVPLYLCIYPMGREEEGILKVMVGAAGTFPFNTTYQKDEEDLSLNPSQQNEKPSYDFGIAFGLEYEFPFGMSIQTRHNIGIMNRFKTPNNAAQTIFDGTGSSPVTGLKNMSIYNGGLGIGYNFASLFSE